jgi:hypothetical protein
LEKLIVDINSKLGDSIEKVILINKILDKIEEKK